MDVSHDRALEWIALVGFGSQRDKALRRQTSYDVRRDAAITQLRERKPGGAG
jgi:hypothetical protein